MGYLKELTISSFDELKKMDNILFISDASNTLKKFSEIIYRENKDFLNKGYNVIRVFNYYDEHYDFLKQELSGRFMWAKDATKLTTPIKILKNMYI